MKYGHLLNVANIALLLCSGCVVAPIPLLETEKRVIWSDRDASGECWSIEQQEDTWYLPIVASPEGPAKMRSGRSHATYYIACPEKKERKELPFLQLDGDYSMGWREFRFLKGTTYVVATRISDRISEEEEARKRGVDITTFEFAIFDREKLKHKRTIETIRWPGSEAQSTWDRLREAPDYRYIDYESPTGSRRFHVLENIDEPIVPETNAN